MLFAPTLTVHDRGVAHYVSPRKLLLVRFLWNDSQSCTSQEFSCLLWLMTTSTICQPHAVLNAQRWSHNFSLACNILSPFRPDLAVPAGFPTHHILSRVSLNREPVPRVQTSPHYLLRSPPEIVWCNDSWRARSPLVTAEIGRVLVAWKVGFEKRPTSS